MSTPPFLSDDFCAFEVELARGGTDDSSIPLIHFEALIRSRVSSTTRRTSDIRTWRAAETESYSGGLEKV
jgi:hypothetical protein